MRDLKVTFKNVRLEAFIVLGTFSTINMQHKREGNLIYWLNLCQTEQAWFV